MKEIKKRCVVVAGPKERKLMTINLLGKKKELVKSLES